MKIRTDREECRVIIDSREQLPWDLSPLDARVGTLQTGDYALLDFPSAISIERKELSDFIGCCGHGRERFQRELDRLRAYDSHAVIIEANWCDLEAGEWRSKIKPQSVLQSISSWLSQGNHIVLSGDRQMAERIARSMLFFAFKHRIEPVKRIIRDLKKTKK